MSRAVEPPLVVIWAEHSFQLYAAYPIARKYRTRGYRIEVFTTRRFVAIAEAYLAGQQVRVRDIDAHKSGVGHRLTHWFRRYCTPHTFSPLYFVRLGYRQAGISGWDRRLNRLLRLRPENLNRAYTRLIEGCYRLGLLKKIDLQPDLFFSFTKVHHAYLLVPFNAVHINIMESWDHPSKEPYLLLPRRSLTWNRALAEETREFQHYNTVHIMRPLKFRYIDEYGEQEPEILRRRITDPELRADLDRIDGEQIVLYPMCTSSNYFGFAGELAFVAELCRIIRDTPFRLYIRPYPLAPDTDRQQLQQLDDQVIVGASYRGTDGAEVLHDELQLHKYLVIRQAARVINTGTTFVFDAALCERPIVQVFFDPASTTDFHRTINEQEHLKRYLQNEHAVRYSPEAIRTTVDSGDMLFSQRIRLWLLDHRRTTAPT